MQICNSRSEEADRAREERRLRRGGTQEEYMTRGNELRSKTNVVRDIRERDKDIKEGADDAIL